MVEADSSAGSADAALRRALSRIDKHPQIVSVSDAEWDSAAERWKVDVEFRVELPSRQKAHGESTSGVRAREWIRFWFPPDRAEAPLATLRADFPRDVPHIQPWAYRDLPVPCISDVPLGEVWQSQGISGIANQMSDWLHRAALDSHNDEERGWEPARRDDLAHWLVADAIALRDHARAKEGFACRFVEYLVAPHDEPLGTFFGLDAEKECALNKENLKETVKGVQLKGGWERGQTLLVLAWPGKEPSGQPIICDEYHPDTVRNLSDVLDTAARLQCHDVLWSGLKRVRECWPSGSNAPRALVVVLLARRPFHIAGTSSCYELFPYVVDVRPGTSGMLAKDRVARPTAHLDRITPALFARLSGAPECTQPPAWSLIGAGSVGSKLAIHLARAGHGPAAVLDGGTPRPHNLARHALLPGDRGPEELAWVFSSKAEKLAHEIGKLRVRCEAFPWRIEHQMKPDGSAGGLCTSKTRAIVNATASLGVRERLARASSLPAPVIECSLFAGSSIAVVTAEGASRNPNTNDLMAECYASIAANPKLARAMFSAQPDIVRQRIGEGCGSPTMVLPDMRVSLASAGMAEYLRARLGVGKAPNEGHVLVGSVRDDGMSVDWQRTEVDPITTVRPVNRRSWEIRIHSRAARKIDADVAAHPGVETGGVLIGRVSEVCRTISVVDVVDAPTDSTRTRFKFVLGREGLRAALDGWIRRTNAALYCVGTWHNHTSPTNPSDTDRATAEAVGISRMVPATLLIRTPDDYRALFAESTKAAEAGEAG